MDEKANQKIPASIGGTAAGDKATLKVRVQALVFSLFLRKPGSFCGYDAEDAFQNILLKVMTRLFSFKGERLYHPGIPV